MCFPFWFWLFLPRLVDNRMGVASKPLLICCTCASCPCKKFRPLPKRCDFREARGVPGKENKQQGECRVCFLFRFQRCKPTYSSTTMDAPVLPMPAPLCLVTNKDGVLALNPAALAVLQEVAQPMVVVAIAGPYRTGKSFLMNRLAQKRTGEPRGKPHPFIAGRFGVFWGISDGSPPAGFPLGPTVQAETKGIWMWCLQHPRQPGVTLVLLDTEGLGDPKKVGARGEGWPHISPQSPSEHP